MATFLRATHFRPDVTLIHCFGVVADWMRTTRKSPTERRWGSTVLQSEESGSEIAQRSSRSEPLQFVATIVSPNLKGEDKLRLTSFASLAIGGGDLFGEGIDPIAAKLWHVITGTQVAIASRGTVTP
jgi:hypothetical protein